MMTQYKQLWQKIKTLNPTILLIAVSILPIPLYFSFLDKTNLAINQAVRKIFTSKPNHIYIPLSSAFLSTPTPSNPEHFIKYHLYDYKLIHLSQEGIDTVEKRISQFVKNKQVVQKLKSQIKKGKKVSFNN
jgi:hypothetical protein